MKSLFGFPVYEQKIEGFGPIVFGDLSEYMTPWSIANAKEGDMVEIKYDGKIVNAIVEKIGPDGTIYLKSLP